MTAPPPPSDPRNVAALVLGCAVHARGPSPTLRRRTLRAAALWHGGAVGLVVPCGGLGRHPPTEAEAMRAMLLDEGVPETAILLEDRSTSTWENLAFARPLLVARGIQRVVLVSDAHHLPRAVMTARGMGLRATGAATPLRGARASVVAKGLVREVPATLIYAARLLAGRAR